MCFPVMGIMGANVKFYFNYLIVTAVISISVISLCIDISTRPEKIDKLGKPATTGEFPYHVSIQFNGTHECSGALISKKHVLTSGEFVYYFKEDKKDESKVQVVAGMTNMSAGGTPYAVKDMNHHPEFDVTTYWKNDIAVIRLVRDVSTSKSVRPAKLPKADHKLYTEQQLLVTGFLYAKSDPPPTKVELMKIFVYVSNDTTCREIFDDRDLTKMFCASVAPKYSGCGRSIGDPVTENKKNVIGLWSDNPGTCSLGSTLLFTYVPSYLPYIESQMNRAD